MCFKCMSANCNKLKECGKNKQHKKGFKRGNFCCCSEEKEQVLWLPLESVSAHPWPDRMLNNFTELHSILGDVGRRQALAIQPLSEAGGID